MNGYKTYIVSALTIAWAVGGFLMGVLDISHAADLILGGAGLGALRSAVATSTAEKKS